MRREWQELHPSRNTWIGYRRFRLKFSMDDVVEEEYCFQDWSLYLIQVLNRGWWSEISAVIRVHHGEESVNFDSLLFKGESSAAVSSRMKAIVSVSLQEQLDRSKKSACIIMVMVMVRITRLLCIVSNIFYSNYFFKILNFKIVISDRVIMAFFVLNLGNRRNIGDSVRYWWAVYILTVHIESKCCL